MRHILRVALVATLPLWVGGCNLFGGDETATVPSPDPVVVPTEPATAVPNTTVPNTTVPTAPAAAGRQGVLPPDLISSTDPGQRVQGIQRNRPDPFALIPTTPSVEITATQAPAQPVPQLPSLPQGRTAPAPSQPPQTSPGSLAPIPQLVPTNPLAALPPSPPQPTLARAVEVTGVVQIGTTVHAIVNAPNEPSSRYVRAGQSLSNGRILVKRIELNQGSEPVVVLEQNGIEVTTAVGEGGTPAAGAPGQPVSAAVFSSSVAANPL